MNRLFHVIVVFILFWGMQACTERMICPAYQSAFIHDEEVLKKRFSYFGEDSMPKVYEASKDKFLIIEPVSYRRKLRNLQTVIMKDIYPQREDSLEFNQEFSEEELQGYDSTAVIEIDTLSASAGDSIYVISLKKEKFNTDQELYLWYLRDYLVYPDVRLQMEQAEDVKRKAMEAGKGVEEEEKRGIGGFFKRLFKKKKKGDQEIEEGELEKTEFDVETNATELGDGDGGEKEGMFGGRKSKKQRSPKEKKKKGTPSEDEPLPSDPAQDEDNGEDDF